MGNYNDSLFNYVLECLKRYCELDPLCGTIKHIDELYQVFKDILKENGITDDSSAEEIFEVFLVTIWDKISPISHRSWEISKLICEYCLKWSEMTIGTGKNAKVVRPPYVMNGSSLSCSITYNEKTYLFDSISGSTMKFCMKDNKKQTISVSVSIKAAFTVNDDKKTPVKPSFKSPEGDNLELVKIDGLGRESLWHFKGEDYVQRSTLIQINQYIAKRYTDAKNYAEWGKNIRSNLSKSVNETGNHASYKRPARDWQDYSGADLGKAHPDTIVNYLTDFYNNLSAKEMQDNLNNYCIGIDCSGFVTRALAYVMEHVKDSLKEEENYMVQIKTLGSLSGIKDNKFDQKRLNEKKYRVYNSATYLKLYRKKQDLGNVYLDDNAEYNSLDIIGSKLLYLFKIKEVKGKKTLECVLINKDLNPADKPEISSLRPGDIITMAKSAKEELFATNFHIAIVCRVGVDQKGPYFITADSSPTTLLKTINDIKDETYSVLKRPDAFDPIKADDLIEDDHKKDGLKKEKKDNYHQKGNGVRFVLHRDFGFFNSKEVLAFRRPYALDRYYRK